MKKGSLKGICPNCSGDKPDNDLAIEPDKSGNCGVCGGKGYIYWKPIGTLK